MGSIAEALEARVTLLNGVQAVRIRKDLFGQITPAMQIQDVFLLMQFHVAMMSYLHDVVFVQSQLAQPQMNGAVAIVR